MRLSRTRLLFNSIGWSPLAWGLTCGFCFVGPVGFGLFLSAHQEWAGSRLPAIAPRVAPSAGFSDLLLVAQIRAANAEGATLLVGSSEFRGRPSVPALLAEKGRVQQASPGVATPREPGGLPAPYIVGYSGSAVWRSVFLLDRGAFYGVTPSHLLLVINPYYAHDNAQSLESAQGAFFPDPASAAFYRCRMRQRPPDEKCDLRTLFFLQSDMFRALLGRIVAIPITHLFRSGSLSGPPSGPAAAIANEFAQERTAFSGAAISPVAGRDFGRALRRLKASLSRVGKTSVLLLLLPLNRSHYEKKGLVARLHERRFVEGTRAIIGSRARVVVLENLRDTKLFADAVHYTARGRAQLAERILVEEAMWRGVKKP